jgi:very-short-patch-repair endonuclease
VVLNERPAAAILRVAAAQGGRFLRAQARALGLTNRQVDGGIAAGLWERELPGVLRAGGVPDTELAAAWAAVLWAGEGAVVSHRSAARVWALDGVQAPDRPEICVPYHRTPRSRLVVVHRSLVLERVDLAVVDGLPVTSPTRTIIDLASVAGDDLLEAAFESARRRGLTTTGRVERRLEAVGGRGRPGAARLRTVLAAVGGGPPAESVLEVKVARLLRAGAVATPVRQHVLVVDGRRYRVDFAWPDHCVVLECDGRTHHSTRSDFQRDRTRWTALASGGHRVLVATWDDATRRPRELVQRVRAALSQDR